MRRMLPIVGLVACGGTWGFGGQDIGNENNPDDYEALDAADLGVESFFSDCVETGGFTSAPDLTAQGGAGTISVMHGVDADDCAELSASVLANAAIEVTYADGTQSPCGGTCGWDVSYTITGVPAGTWTLAVEGATAEVTVE